MDCAYSFATIDVLVSTETAMDDKIDNHVDTTFKSTLEDSEIDGFFKEVEEIRKHINDIRKDAEYFEYMYSTFICSKPTDEDRGEGIISLLSNLRKKFHIVFQFILSALLFTFSCFIEVLRHISLNKNY